MKFISFENTGILEPEFIKSFGVSVKSDNSCIGFFGTGLKYAIAILIRQGAKVSIYSDGEVMHFGKKSVTLKGKSFDFITMNGEQIPFTTELGKTWEPWMAYRELYSNAKDEGGGACVINSLPEHTEGKTFVVVAGGEIESIHKARDSIFIGERLPISDGIYNGGGSFFSKGVCVWKYEGMPSIYSYSDSTGYCDLTEDRQIKYTHQVYKICADIIAKVTDKEVLRSIVTADTGVFESRIDFDYCSISPSLEFMEVARANRDLCNNAYLLSYMERNEPAAPLVDFTLNEYQKEILNDAIFSVKMAGFMVDEFPIRTVSILKNDALGQAAGGVIFLSEKCFLMGGLEMLKATLIEEWVHLKHHYRDCERPMQNYLFEQVVRLVDLNNSIVKNKYSKAA